MKTFILLSLKFYKNLISPVFEGFFGHGCRFTPTCSDYAQMAIVQFGVLVGLKLAIRRIIKCNPFTKVGYDPLPIKA